MHGQRKPFPEEIGLQPGFEGQGEYQLVRRLRQCEWKRNGVEVRVSKVDVGKEKQILWSEQKLYICEH